MKLAVNYSLEAAGLISAGSIPMDMFKSPEWPELVEEAQAIRPVYVHFGHRAGPGGLDGVDWALVDDLLSRTATRYINIHLYPPPGSFPNVRPNAADHTSIQAVTEGMLASVLDLTKRFGPERVIAENLPYWEEMPDDVIRPAVEPETIRQIVSESNCQFLLDISHACIAAKGLRMGYQDYISALPVEKMREMHISGLGVLEGRLRDHQRLSEDDWAALDWAMEQIRTGRWAAPWLATFEYGGIRLPPPWPYEQSVLAEQVPRMYELVHAVA